MEAVIELCARAEAAAGYLRRVRERFLALAGEIGARLPPELARREEANVRAIVATIERALASVARLREAACEVRQPALAEAEVENLYKVLVASSSVPLPSQVRAVIDEVYVTARRALRGR